jgi:dUTP pyrophosphatase
MAKVLFKKLSEAARVPKKSTTNAAGYDLYSPDEHELQPGERHLYKTNVATAIPPGMYGRIAPRSGLAYNNGINVMAGVIDADYRDDIGVLLINNGNAPWKPAREKDGSLKAIAQIIFEFYNDVDLQEIADLPKPDSNRTGGIGSSDGTGGNGTDLVKDKNKNDGPNLGGPPKPNLQALYEKTGGIPTRIPYSDQMKGRQD